MSDVPCTTCGKPLVAGQLRRHDEHHSCYVDRMAKLKRDIGLSVDHVFGKKRRNNRPPDIKAPDQFVLGGTRKVLKDGTIRLSGTYYQCPPEWAGRWLSCHINGDGTESIDVAMDEGLHVYVARTDRKDRLFVAPLYVGSKPDPVNRTAENIRKQVSRT